MSEMCSECGKRPIKARGLCNPCYKRLVWRPRGGEAVDREREDRRARKEANPDAWRERERGYDRKRYRKRKGATA